MKRTLNDYYRDVWYFSSTAFRLTEGMTYDQFMSDERTRLAVQKALENIGEAVRHIPASDRKIHPEIPWTKIRGMRNKLVHEYFGVKWKVVWDTATSDLPPLLPSFKKIVAELDQELFDKLDKGSEI